MAVLEIPVGFASVFLMILIGYFVLTVWFSQMRPPVVVKSAALKSPADEPSVPGRSVERPALTHESVPRELNAG